MSSQVSQQFLGPTQWKRACSHVTPFAAAFDFNENDSHLPTFLPTRSPSFVIVFYFRK
jgi:hypothetical protein